MSTLSNWNFPGGHKNNLRPMRASRWPLFVNLEDIPKGQIHLRQISKIKQYDAIDKNSVRRRVWFTRECFPGSQKVLVGKKIAQKEMPMTINECRWQWTSTREVLTHLSTAYLADLPKHWGVRAKTYVEYVQSTCLVCAKWEQGYGPRSPGGRL